jgi:hypothetical protein
MQQIQQMAPAMQQAMTALQSGQLPSQLQNIPGVSTAQSALQGLGVPGMGGDGFGGPSGDGGDGGDGG